MEDSDPKKLCLAPAQSCWNNITYDNIELGSNYGEEQTVIEISINKDNAMGDEEEREDLGVEDDAEDETGEKDDDGDSFTTAASSLSSVNVCKICHCGEEVSSFWKVKGVNCEGFQLLINYRATVLCIGNQTDHLTIFNSIYN